MLYLIKKLHQITAREQADLAIKALYLIKKLHQITAQAISWLPANRLYLINYIKSQHQGRFDR